MEVKSPCIKVCTIKDGICVGCHRTETEIREWFYATDERKEEILKRIAYE
jgi:predicted Fe-S protein YdhL (DUF1289 family)